MGFIAAVYLLLLVLVGHALARFSNSAIKWYFEPMFLVACFWIIGLSLYSLPVYTYREKITLETTVYIMVAHTAFFVGTFCGSALSSTRSKEGRVAPSYGYSDSGTAYSFRLMLGVGALGLLGLCAVAANGLLSDGLGLGDRLDTGGLTAARAQTFSNAAAGISSGPFQRFEQFTAAAFLYIGLLVNMRFDGVSSAKQKILVTLGVVCGIIIVFNQLLIRGGRMDLITLLLFMIFAISLDPSCRARIYLSKFFFRHRVVMISVVLPLLGALIYLLAVVFVQGRSGKASALDLMHAYHRLGLSPWVRDLVEGAPALETLMLSISYFVVPMTTLSYYFGLSDAAFSGPYWGQYNFSYLSGFILRRLDMVNEGTVFWEIRAAVWASLAMHGYGTNVWATLLRDLAIDFGWLGSVFGMFVLGLTSKWLALAAISRRDAMLISAYGFTAVFLVFSFAHSMFFVTSVFPPFMYAMLIYVFMKIRSSGVVRGATSAQLITGVLPPRSGIGETTSIMKRS